jgi:hypothetical protein
MPCLAEPSSTCCWACSSVACGTGPLTFVVWDCCTAWGSWWNGPAPGHACLASLGAQMMTLCLSAWLLAFSGQTRASGFTNAAGLVFTKGFLGRRHPTGLAPGVDRAVCGRLSPWAAHGNTSNGAFTVALWGRGWWAPCLLGAVLGPKAPNFIYYLALRWPIVCLHVNYWMLPAVV